MAAAKDRGRGDPSRGGRTTSSSRASGGSRSSSRSSSQRTTAARGSSGSASAARKPAPKSSTAKKPAPKKQAPKKPAAGSSAGKSGAARKPAPQKAAPGRSAPKKPAPKKPASKASTGQRSGGRQQPRPSGSGARRSAPQSGARRSSTGRSNGGSAARKVTTNGLVAPGSTPRPRQRPAPRKAPQRRPRKPSAAQLRRRRSLRNGALLVLLCAGLLVGLGTAAGYGIGRAVDGVRELWPEARPDLTAEKAAPPEPLNLAGPADTCTSGAVALDLSAGATTLAEGDVVPFTLRVTNEGRMPCLLDGRGSSMQVVVSDAEGERVWSSADCGGGGGADLLLGVGDPWDTTVRWSGSTSAPGCEGKRVRVPPGDYTAEIVLGDVPDASGEPVTVTVAEPPAKEPSPEASEKTDEESDEAAEAETDEKKADGDDEKKTDEKDPPADDHEKKD